MRNKFSYIGTLSKNSMGVEIIPTARHAHVVFRSRKEGGDS